MKNMMPFLLLLAVCCSACSTTRIYIVRHGERLNSSDTTSLSEIGYERAETLALVLADKDIDSIFVSDYARTRQTAQPTADRLNLPLITYNPRPAELIASRLKNIKNKNVLVVGHSDTILEVAKRLETTPTRSKIEGTDFDNFLVVRIKRTFGHKKTTLQELTYGRQTPP
jgi:broad specificity phosphatase PhoE